MVSFPFVALNANPSGSTVTHGSASFSQQGSTLNITNSPGTVIDWQNFSIQKDETTRFIQQSVDSAVLNRVVGQDPSQILGKLQSNGRVFILNPNGILFGANSVIDVGGLVASTLNISNENFLSQQLNFNGDGSSGLVNNQGEITTPEGGFVYLIAPNIENHGVITSPKGEVTLAAGHSVQLVSSDNPDLRVTITAPEGEALNVGDIITRGGKTSIYAGLIRQQGTINADSAVVGENGKIFFKATKSTKLSSTSVLSANSSEGGNVTLITTEGLTEVSGTISVIGINNKGGTVQILGDHVGVLNEANINASGLTGGGTVLIGGDNQGDNPDIKNAKATYIGQATEIHADAIQQGDGGTVIVWSDDATRTYGSITAKGGTHFGNGGYVETSGGYLDIAGINLDVTANNGTSGSWLLDPYDITITGTTTVNAIGGPTYYTPDITGSNIFNGDISSALDADTNVTIDTTNGGGSEAGNITVSASILKTTGTGATLTLKAHNNIITDASIGSMSGLLNIDLIADQDSNGVGSVTLNNTLTSLGGNISISAAGDVTLNSGTNTINAGAGTVTLTSANGWVHGDPAGAPVDVIANTVSLNALNGIFANSGSAQFTTQAANINFNKSGTAFPSEVKIHNSYVGPTTITGINSRGNISIFNTDNANALTVGNLTATIDGYISINTDIIDITGSVNAGANVIYLKNFVNNAAISLEGGALFDINSAEIANITAGNIQIGKDPFGNYAGAATLASSAVLALGGKNVWVTAKNGINTGTFSITNIGGKISLDNITTGAIQTGSGSMTANNITLTSVGDINIGSGTVHTEGDLSLGSANFIVQSGDLSTGSGGVVFLKSIGATLNNISAAGDITIETNQISIAGLINANGNNAYILPLMNNAISIDGSEVFDLTQGELANISAANVWIGSDGTTTRATTASISTNASTTISNAKLDIFALNDISFGANNFTSSGEVFFKSTTGNVTTGAGLVSADILVLEGLGLMSIGNGGITATNYAGLNGGDIFISGTVTSPIFYLSVFNPGSAISIGGGQAFNIAQADIDFISSGITYIGNNPYVANTNNVNIATASPIDFGARNIVIESHNGVLVGSNALKATGGNLTINSSNAGFDITTGTGNIAADSVTFNSSRDIIVNSGGINAVNSITLAATNTVDQSGDLTANGTGTITVSATNQDIAMAAATTTTGGNGDIVYNAGNNITVAYLDSGLADIALNAAGSILDVNGNGVNNINANNLTVSSGGNSSLDYQIVGALSSTGVVGTADLRVYPATTAAGTTASTNEPITTTIDTISDTTNSLSTDTSLASTTTSTTTAPLTDTSVTTESTIDSTNSESSGAANETTETTTTSTSPEETQDESSEEIQVASAKKTNKRTKKLAQKKLPICK